MVNMLEESTLNNHIVLQQRISKIAFWMSLKSSEMYVCSWSISAILESSFHSSSCCRTCFPSSVRPMNRLWELNLWIFFDSPEWIVPVSSRCTVWECRRRWITFIDTSWSAFFHRNDTRWIIHKFSSLWFCFCLRSACKIFHSQLYRLFFKLIFRNFCVVVLRIHHKFVCVWSMRNSDPRVNVVSVQRPSSNLDCWPYKQLVVTSSTNPNFVFPKIHLLGCGAPFSPGKVYPRQVIAWNCSPVSSVMKYCPISTTLRIPAYIENLLNSSCCGSPLNSFFILLW